MRIPSDATVRNAGTLGKMSHEIEACVTRIEEAIKRSHPEIPTLFVKPQTAETLAQTLRQTWPLYADKCDLCRTEALPRKVA
jgi:hypothetical protein